MNKLARWVPALAAPVVIVCGAIAIPAIASAQGPLPTKTPAQVLELVAKSDTAAYSGTVQQSSDLGLPDLSALEQQSGGGASSNSLVDLLTAAHTTKVYTDGGTKQRLQVLDNLAERDVVRDGNSVWLYDSAQKQATHLALSNATGGTDSGAHTPAPAVTPAQAAAQLIAELKPTTDFGVASDERIAGRATYRLTLSPKTSDTLVNRVTVAVDSTTGVPLDVAVYAKGQAKPAATAEFTSIDYATPAASDFAFTPPAGTKVETQTIGGAQHPGATQAIPDGQRPTVLGSGWNAIAELPSGGQSLTQLESGATAGDGTSGTGGMDASSLLGLLQPVSGGRGLQTSLISVLITNDGRVLAGAVPLSSLENAAQ
ncbi:outer membrane lipoprotein carrier protein LolA [Gryllotalpicola reticulitermitis]|uniref:Outer membrane lipoprotein carrier protein LolA n=1 Tax=Gryllotalpicola reticulitermitis TaxID=1184153 RepID=A0ABV8Q5Z5_9MICO